MLVRTFRLTDKLSNALLKLMIYVVWLTLLRLHGLRRAAETTVISIVMTLALVFGVVLAAGSRITRRGAKAATAAAQQQTRLRQVMVQRSEYAALERRERELSGGVIEDPLIVRNRSLSAITVILLVVLIAFLVWTPATLNNASFGSAGGGIIPTLPSGENPNPVIPTPSPSATEANPLLLNITGTLAFTLRQGGQDDIWALPVGSSQPVRLTDSLNDDRDPAWSPDGSKIAFASRRDGRWNLYVIDLAQGQTTQLTFTDGYVGAPSWSPDGEFIAYEAYNEDSQSIDIFIISRSGEVIPRPVTTSPYPDLEPAWSPGGREIAYVGWRSGSQDVLVINLDGQPEGEALNLTHSADTHENNPVWSPDGARIAYTANVGGVEGIYIQSVISPTDSPRLIGRGRMAAWNPVDGSSVFYAVTQNGSSALYLGQVENFAVGASAIAFSGRVSHVDWTESQHSLSGFDPRTPPLYEEELTQLPNGKIGLALLNSVDAPDPVLSDAVNDSFDALRTRAQELVGYDLLGSLESVFWRRERLPEPGQERQSWHYTGRAFSLTRDMIFAGNPTPLVVVREETETGTAWRVYARAAESAQDGSLGEPLRTVPWDFSARADDPTAFEQGGRLMDSVPPGYYVDVTLLFQDYGWERVHADRTWRSNFSAVLFWQFQKTDGLTWEAAMLEVYTQQEVQDFIQGNVAQPPTPIPTATPTDIPGGDRPRTPTPIPPDAG